MRSRSRSAVAALAAVAALTLTSVAAASPTPEMPCQIPRTIRSPTDMSTTVDREGVAGAWSSTATQWRMRYAGTFTYFTFDDLDGEGASDFDLAVAAAHVEYERLAATAAGLHRRKIEVIVPLLSLDGPERGDDADGLGDIVISSYFTLLGDVDNEWLDAELAASLPTGDEEDGLGAGGSLFLGGRWFRRLTENWQLDVGAGYLRNVDEEDHPSYWRAVVGMVHRFADRAALQWNVEAFFESGEGHETAAGDPISESPVDAQATFRLRVDRKGGDRATLLRVGVRVPLNDEGLHDDFTPTIGLEWVKVPRSAN